MIPLEQWKQIHGYEGLYWISNVGKVKNRFGKVLKPGRGSSGKGYLQVTLCKHGVVKSALLHRLVASAFIGNPEGYPQVNHKDENMLNNHVSNLEWCTAKYNINYGNHPKHASVAHSKGVFVIFSDGTDKYFLNQNEAAKYFHTSANYFNHWVTGFRNNPYGLTFESLGGVA